MANTKTDAPRWLDAGRIPSLDGLRAVAVLLVILAHAHQTVGFPDVAALHALGSRASVGVDIFFVISGFLITTLLLREVGRTGRLDVKGFYVRRFLRIVPAYACLLLAVAGMAVLGLAQLTARDWALALTYTVNFVHKPAWEIGHAWSLSIEEHFYLVWPLLMACSAAVSRRAALTCLAFCFLARWAVLLFFPAFTPMAELWTFTRLDAIAAGCLLAFLAREPRWRGRLDRFASSPVAVLLALGCLAGSLAVPSAKLTVGFGYSINAVCIALLLWAAVSGADSLAGRALNTRWLGAVGVMSYSLYLWQQPFLRKGVYDFACRFPQNLVFAFLAALASYHLVEKPFLALRRGRTESSPGPRVRPAQTAPEPVAV